MQDSRLGRNDVVLLFLLTQLLLLSLPMLENDRDGSLDSSSSKGNTITSGKLFSYVQKIRYGVSRIVLPSSQPTLFVGSVSDSNLYSKCPECVERML